MMFNEHKDACCLREVLVHCGFEFCPQVLSLGWIWKKRKHFLYCPMSSFSTAFLHSAFQAASPQLLSSENQHRPINAQGRKPTDKKAKQGCGTLRSTISPGCMPVFILSQSTGEPLAKLTWTWRDRCTYAPNCFSFLFGSAGN